MKKMVLALTGMPGAGKTEAARYLSQLGYPVLRLGTVTDQGLDALHLPHTEDNERRFRQNVRHQHGMAAYAIQIYPQLEKALINHTFVILDGVRSWEEYLFLKRKIRYLSSLAILSTASIRHRRLSHRNKRKLTLPQARKRDMEELTKLHACPTIVLSDFFIINDGKRTDFYKRLREVVQKLHVSTENEG